MIYTTVDRRSPAPVEIYYTKMLHINSLDRFLSINNINIVSTFFLSMFFSHPTYSAQQGGFPSVLNLTPILRGSRFNEGVERGGCGFNIDSD